MARSGRELVDRMRDLMSTGDVSALVERYAPDAETVLYHRVSVGRDEIRDLLATSLASHDLHKLVSIDQYQDTGDIVM